MYEISIVLRDNVGNELLTPDGRVRRKVFYANSGDVLADLWARNGGRTRNKKNKNKGVEKAEKVNTTEKVDQPEGGDTNVQNREEASPE